MAESLQTIESEKDSYYHLAVVFSRNIDDPQKLQEEWNKVLSNGMFTTKERELLCTLRDFLVLGAFYDAYSDFDLMMLPVEPRVISCDIHKFAMCFSAGRSIFYDMYVSGKSLNTKAEDKVLNPSLIDREKVRVYMEDFNNFIGRYSRVLIEGNYKDQNTALLLCLLVNYVSGNEVYDVQLSL